METMETFFDAIKNGDMGKVNGLLEQDSSLLRARSEGGISPILLALYYGKRDMAEWLVKQDVALDTFEASAVGSVDRAQGLLESEPELANAWASDGFQPLGLASFFGNTEVARLLISNGSQVSSPFRNNMQALTYFLIARSHGQL